MAELTSQERLQPSLLDRLSDDEPGNRQESRDQRVLSVQRLREGVLRDLSWLLNTGNLAATEDLSEYPQVESSVLNYGVPDLAGMSAKGLDLKEIEKRLQLAVRRYEPRILEDSVKIRVVVQPGEMSHKAVQIQIEGSLWAQPVPERLYLRTEVDLETGSVTLFDAQGGS